MTCWPLPRFLFLALGALAYVGLPPVTTDSASCFNASRLSINTILHTTSKQECGEGVCSNIQFVLCICPSLRPLQSLICMRSTIMTTTAALWKNGSFTDGVLWEISGGCIFRSLQYTVSMGVSYILDCKIWPVWYNYCSRELVLFTAHLQYGSRRCCIVIGVFTIAMM